MRMLLVLAGFLACAGGSVYAIQQAAAGNGQGAIVGIAVTCTGAVTAYWAGRS